jgi:hypothetical protein
MLAAGEPCRANNVRANERANKYKIGKYPQMFCSLSLSLRICLYTRAAVLLNHVCNDAGAFAAVIS